MALTDLLKKGRLEGAWSYTTEGVLWQIQTGSNRVLVGEDREIGKKETSFFCVERRTGKILWRNMNPGDRWWIGVEAVTDEVVVFHGFASPDMPGHKSITVADLESGRVLWSNPDLKFIALGQGSITACAESYGKRELVQVAPLTGEILKKLDAEVVELRPPSGGEKESGDGLLLPSPVRGEAEREPAIAHCLNRNVTAGLHPAQVLLLDSNGLVIVQISEPRGRRQEGHPDLHTVLKIIDRGDGRVLYSAILEEHASAVSPHFFVQDGLLYYVSERKTLSALFISSGSFRDRVGQKDPA
jgi:hypothetical protein